MNCCLAASERDRESVRISVQTYLRITESIESDMLSHDRHASIKLWKVDHSPHFDYRVRAAPGARDLDAFARDSAGGRAALLLASAVG